MTPRQTEVEITIQGFIKVVFRLGRSEATCDINSKYKFQYNQPKIKVYWIISIGLKSHLLELENIMSTLNSFYFTDLLMNSILLIYQTFKEFLLNFYSRCNKFSSEWNKLQNSF